MAIHINSCHIGTDNSKTGFHTLSTTACKTCTHKEECEKFCYASKCERIYPTVKAMHETQTHNIETNLTEWENDFNLYLDAYRPMVLRVNESGDFNTANGDDYFAAVMNAAINHPNTIFQGMSKCVEIINAWLANNGGKLPNNVKLSISEFPGFDASIHNPYNLPVSYVYTKDMKKAATAIRDGFVKCPNQAQTEMAKKTGVKPIKKWQCIDCMMNHCGCFGNNNLVWFQH